MGLDIIEQIGFQVTQYDESLSCYPRMSVKSAVNKLNGLVPTNYRFLRACFSRISTSTEKGREG